MEMSVISTTSRCMAARFQRQCRRAGHSGTASAPPAPSSPAWEPVDITVPSSGWRSSWVSLPQYQPAPRARQPPASTEPGQVAPCAAARLPAPAAPRTMIDAGPDQQGLRLEPLRLQRTPHAEIEHRQDDQDGKMTEACWVKRHVAASDAATDATLIRFSRPRKRGLRGPRFPRSTDRDRI